MLMALVTRFVAATRFFSILPLPGPHVAPNMNQMAPLLGPVSLLIALPSAITLIVAHSFGFSSLISAGLALTVAIFISGAMGEDAVGDSADALFGGKDKAHRREILKDSRLGTFGVAALGMLMLLHFSALASMVAKAPLDTAACILGAAMVARSMGLWQMTQLQPAYENGLAAQSGTLGLQHFGLGLGISILLALIVVSGAVGLMGLIVTLVICAGLNIALSQLWRDKFGGFCGDTIGTSIRLTELCALLILSLFV